MDYYLVSSLITMWLQFTLGIFAYLKNKQGKENKAFFVLCLAAGIWSLSDSLLSIVARSSFDKTMSLYIIRLLQVGIIFFPSTFVGMSFAISNESPHKYFKYFLGYFPLFLWGLTIFTPLVIRGLTLEQTYFYTRYLPCPGQLYSFLVLFMVWSFCYWFYRLFCSYRASSGLKKTQIKYYLLASFIGAWLIPIVFFNIFGIRILALDNFISTLSFLIITYAILRHRLMDIQVAFSRSLVAILLGVCVIGFDVLFVKLLHPAIGYYFSGAIAMLIIGGVLFATPLSKKLQLGVDQMVLGGKYNYQNILREASRTVLTILDLNDLVNYIINMLRQSLGVEKIAILLKDVEGYKLQYGHGVEEQMQSGYKIKDSIIEWLENKKEVFVKEEQLPAQMFSDMEKIGAELVVPLFHKGELEGILTLSAKGTGEPYVQSDIDLFEILGANISTAIRNARVYNEAVTDSLTGLYRHEYFQLRLVEEIEKSKRNRSFLSLLVIDLDQFKEINERYGSEVRDIVLKRLAIILRKNVEKTDIVSRYGTDGFAVILFGANSNLVAERLRKEVAREEFVVVVGARSPRPNRDAEQKEGWGNPAPTSIRMTVSIGVACFDGRDAEFTEKGMLIRANSAAATVKNRGGNGVEVG